MFPMALVTIGSPLRFLHDHLGMKTLLVSLFRLLVASRTVHPLIRSLRATLGMLIIFNMGMAI